jgi:hypothetical protein
MERHPFLAIFPASSDQADNDLQDDIKKNGLRFPIVRFESKNS